MSRLARISAAALCFAPGWLAAATDETEPPAAAAVAGEPDRDEARRAHIDEAATAEVDEAASADADDATPPDADVDGAEPGGVDDAASADADDAAPPDVDADGAEPGDVDDAASADADDFEPAVMDDAAGADAVETPVVDEAAEDRERAGDDDGPIGADEPAHDAAPAPESPAEPAADLPSAPEAAPGGEVTAPVADEEGVLPGEPGDEPGVGLPVDAAAPVPADEAVPSDLPGTDEPAPPAGARPPSDTQGTIFVLGTEVPPGAIDWLSWSASESFEGIATPTPILIVNGKRPGPTLCLTAALHGDELNGVEMVRRIMYSLDPEKLSGAVIGAPIVNLHGFRRSSRYLPDRRDLNRYFPGSPTGSSASRIAHSFFHEIIVHCDALVDVHTGSFHRSNLPQLRADLNIPAVVDLTKGFGATVVLHSRGARGTLRRAATDEGIPAVTLEAGEPMRLQPKEVAHGVKGIETLLDKLGMVKKASFWGDPQPVYYESRWIRVNTGGILFSNVNLGERVRKNEVLGTVTDPITNKRSQIVSPWDGRIIGRALNQVVMPGFAAFHVGIQTSEEEIHQKPPDVANASGAEDVEDGEAEGGASAEDAAPPSDAGDEQGEDPEYLEDERPE